MARVLFTTSSKADTRVSVLDESRGLIGGLAIVWNQWVIATKGGKPVRCCYEKSADYHPIPGGVSLLVDHDHRQYVGPVDRLLWKPQGLYAYATCHDPWQMMQIKDAGLYFSVSCRWYYPGPRVKGGLIGEISLVRDPATRPTLVHRTQDERRAGIFGALKLLEWIEADQDENPNAYADVDGMDAYIKGIDRYRQATQDWSDL